MEKEKLDNTFKQCCHGIPRCKFCDNKRVVEWKNIKDKLPKTEEIVLLCDNEHKQIMLGFLSIDDNKFTEVNTCNKDFHNRITHWANIYRLHPFSFSK
jgi:hypothetical protein